MTVHYCFCGEWGAFGENVWLLKGKPGTWYCRKHWKEKEQARMTQGIARMKDGE